MAQVTILLAKPANGVSPSGTLTNTTGLIRLSVSNAAGTGPSSYQLIKQNADSTAWYFVPNAVLNVDDGSVGQLNWEDLEGNALYHVVQTRPSGQSAVLAGATGYLSASSVISQSVGAVTTTTLTASGAIVGQSTLAVTGAVTHSSTLTQTGIATFNAAPVFAAGLTASGAVANDFSGSTADFSLSTGAAAWAGASGKALSFVSTAAAMTLTAGAASTWKTSAGALTVDSAAALQLGTTAATSIAIGNGAIAVAVTSSGASSLVVGANGATNPALKVDSSTASSATGLQIKSAAAAAGVALLVLSSGSNENLTINAKGTGTITAQSAVAVPAGGSAGASLLLSSTAALGIYVGSGAPTVSAAQGSFYLRTDGSSSSTRLYVNSSGSTTWVAVTTAS
jgi:hypothetical protein